MCNPVRLLATVFALFAAVANALDNGLARTPPMGWLSWERFRCNIDCKNDPQNCIGENLFKAMADHIVADGYKDAGYEYVNIDDCWLAKERDSNGRLQPDPDRFPSGMKALADYMHSKGLKLGIYEDFGTHTCGGYPGSEYFLQMDAQTFADWGVDYLKLDGCYSDPKQYDDEYPPVAFYLNKTGRSIFLSCEYPLYQLGEGLKPNYTRLAKACNLARNGKDVQDSWGNVASILAQYAENEGDFASVAGPGFFNDPDMLIIGNYGLSWDQQRVQMALWCIMASPLIMSNDLRQIRPESKTLLQNKYAIAINQDAMGKQGRRIHQMGDIDVWTKPILPNGSLAFALVNYGTHGTPSKVSLSLKDMGVTSSGNYTVYEVFANQKLGVYRVTDALTTEVNPTGVFFGKAIPV